MGKAKINAKKSSYDGHEFDSQTEREYYEYLKGNVNVSEIKLQPQFTLMGEFTVTCGRCDNGKVTSKVTGNLIKCKTCRGTGERKRRPWTYTSDFKVTYTNGKTEIIEVKGFANEKFPLVRKMFENKYGKELVVIKKKKGEWVRT